MHYFRPVTLGSGRQVSEWETSLLPKDRQINLHVLANTPNKISLPRWSGEGIHAYEECLKSQSTCLVLYNCRHNISEPLHTSLMSLRLLIS